MRSMFSKKDKDNDKDKDKNNHPTESPAPPNSKTHIVNWYVHRDQKIRMIMTGLWGNPKNIVDKETMEGATISQKTHKLINILFRLLENNGPMQTGFSNFKYDSNNGMFHCHVNDMLVMWEASQEDRIITIKNIAPHENFKFKIKNHKKQQSIEKAKEARKADEKFNHYQFRFPYEKQNRNGKSESSEKKHDDRPKKNGR